MMARFIKALILFMVLILSAGCATRKEIVRFQEDLNYLRWQTESIQKNNQALQSEVKILNQRLAELLDETRRTRAELLAMLDQVQTQSRILDTKLDDNFSKMTRIVEKRRVTVPTPSQPDSVNSEARAVPADADHSMQIYQSAFLDLTRGNYSLALSGFKYYLENFPSSDLADDAQFWLGEILYAQQDYTRAIEEFKKTIVNFPKSDRIPATLLKIGYSYTNIGNSQTSKQYYQILIDRFPTTEEARLARSRLAAE